MWDMAVYTFPFFFLGVGGRLSESLLCFVGRGSAKMMAEVEAKIYICLHFAVDSFEKI